MTSTLATDLLNFWEESANVPLLHKTISLLAFAFQEPDADKLYKMSIGQRDRRLLLLRKRLFGSRLPNMADCPLCQERTEWTCKVEDLLGESLQNPEDSEYEYLFESGDFSIRYRLPNTYDMHRITADKQNQLNPLNLLVDCILEVKSHNESYDVGDLPENLLEALQLQMEEKDPQADISFNLTCPNCSHQWIVFFDIAGYLWKEIDNWAIHVFNEVYVLAKNFGWSESEILRMTPQRRQIYIDMIKG